MRTLRLAALALLCTTGFAQAAPPEVNGKFAYISQTFCEAKLTLVKDNKGFVKDVQLTQSGMMSSSIGYITFNQAMMTAKITGATLIEGGALRIGTTGFNWSSGTDNVTDQPYSFTNTGFTFGGQTYKMVFADAGSGENQFRQVYLVRKTSNGATPSNPNCVETIWATKQPGEL